MSGLCSAQLPPMPTLINTGHLPPVHKNSLAFAFALSMAVAIPEPAHAAPEQDALLFLDSRVMPRKAAACSARIASYSGRFEPAFRAWLARNKEHVAAGEAFLRADAERTKTPFEPDVEAVAVDISQRWTSAPLPTLQDNCEALLIQLRESEGG